MTALLEAASLPEYPAEIAVVISNEPGAAGRERARAAGVPVEVIDHRAHGSRRAHEEAVAGALRRHAVEWVALAGYMRVLGGPLLDAYPNRILNIHPALLPAFPGTHAQRQALQYGVRVSGCTVHLVDAGVDSGPIVLQEAVAVEPEDTEHTLSQRILAAEHRLYPRALALAAGGRLRIDGRRVTILPGAERAPQPARPRAPGTPGKPEGR